MAGLTEFDVRNSCDTVSFHIAVAESAVQFRHFFVMDIVKPHRLFDNDLCKNREDRKKYTLCFNTESIVSNGSKQGEEDKNDDKIKPFFHIHNLLKQV